VDSLLDDYEAKDWSEEPYFEGSPLLRVPSGEHLEVMQYYLVLVIHVLSKLEVKESHFVLSEVRGELHINLLAIVGDLPLGVMVLSGAVSADCLDEVLCLLERGEVEGSLEISQVASCLPVVHTASLNDVCDPVLIHLFEFLFGIIIQLVPVSLEFSELSYWLVIVVQFCWMLVLSLERHEEHWGEVPGSEGQGRSSLERWFEKSSCDYWTYHLLF
jgi:hypothetical protein